MQKIKQILIAPILTLGLALVTLWWALLNRRQKLQVTLLVVSEIAKQLGQRSLDKYSMPELALLVWKALKVEEERMKKK